MRWSQTVVCSSALTDLVARRRAARGPASAAGPAPLPQSWTVVIVDRPLDQRLAAVLREARDVGVLDPGRGATRSETCR